MAKEGAYLGWERNTEGIKSAAQKKRQDSFDKADEAIKSLIKNKKPINFESVAQAAGVSRQWIYNQPELKSRIETLRAQQSPKKAIPQSQSASDASKDAIIKTLRQRLRKVEEENKEIQKRIEVAYGMAQADLVGDLAKENKDLEKQNQHLMRLLNEARTEIDRLKAQSNALETDAPC
jgi:Mg2+ and Co2+ transporter CorA